MLKMEGFQTLKGSWPWPSIRPYGIPLCITHRPLPIYQISFKLKKLFVDGRTNGQTYGRTDRRTDIFPLYTIRSTFGSRPNKYLPYTCNHQCCPTKQFKNYTATITLYVSKCTSRGVLNPKPTFLVYRGTLPALPESSDFFLFKKVVGCFWKARSDYKTQSLFQTCLQLTERCRPLAKDFTIMFSLFRGDLSVTSVNSSEFGAWRPYQNYNNAQSLSNTSLYQNERYKNQTHVFMSLLNVN